MRLLAQLILPLLLLLCGCPAEREDTVAATSSSPRRQDADATGGSEVWLDPEAKVSSAIRLTSPAGIDVRQAAYWQPGAGEGQPRPPLQVLLRTRDYNQRVEGVPDPQRIAVLDLLSGETRQLDEDMAGLPLKLTVSPDHQRAVVALLEPLVEDKGYSLQAVNLRAYGYGEQPAELRPQPSVEPFRILDDGGVLCRIVRNIVVVNGLPAVGYDWLSGTQLCIVPDQSFSALGEPAIPGPGGKLNGGYSVSYDPALPDRARITYWLGDGGRDTRRWELGYFAGSAPFDWSPPVRWLNATSYATLAYRRGALDGESGILRIVALESSGAARLIEDRVAPGVTFVTAGSLLLYPLRSGTTSWSVWAASADGMDKQRVWTANSTDFLEVLDIVDGRRVLLHRQYFGETRELHSELIELSLDPLQATAGKAASTEVSPLPEPKGIVEDESPAAQSEAQPPPDDLFPSDPGDGGFIPDAPPGGGPPPISGG